MNTTKKFIGTAFALLLTTFTFAQVSLGLKAGVNFANISKTDVNLGSILQTSGNTSVTFGGVADFHIANGFSIQPEINYSKKGFEVVANIPLGVLDVELPVGIKAITDLNYIEAPILAKYSFGNGRVGGYVTAGPTFGYAKNARFKTAANFIIDINIINRELDLDALRISRFDVGGAIGAGGTVNLGSTKLFIDARYTQGFKNLDNVPLIDLGFKNRNFALTTGFLIPLSRGYSSPRA